MTTPRYLSRFLQSRSCEDVVGVFSRCSNAAKEITESWGLLEAARRWVPGLDSHYVIVVGDGSLPRTATLFAFYTRCPGVWSVDPALNETKWEEWVAPRNVRRRRLTIIKSKVENVNLSFVDKTVPVPRTGGR